MPKEATLPTRDAPSLPNSPGPAGLDAMIAQATADYRELVRRHAQGEPIDQGELDKSPSRAGRSLVQFRADGERLRKRFAAAALVDNAEEMAKEIEPAQRRVAEAEKELNRLNEQYYPKAAELRQKVAAAQADFLRKEGRMSDSRHKALDVLRETAAPEILGQLHRLRGAFAEAQHDTASCPNTMPRRFNGGPPATSRSAFPLAGI